MDPYEVLGVSKEASADDIRKAYRQLAKKYHPDVNQDERAAEMTAMINAAYDRLNDPEKKSAFDNVFVSPYKPSDDDPVDKAYDIEYDRQDVEEVDENAIEKIRRQAQRYKFARVLCYPIAFFSLLIILDNLLPVNGEVDYPISGYQKKRSSRVQSYMKTTHYEFEVPNNVHADYDYKANEKKPLYLEFTPIFKTLRRIGVDHDEYAFMYEAPGSMYLPLLFPFPCALLFLSGFFIVKNKSTRMRYVSCLTVIGVALIYFSFLLL